MHVSRQWALLGRGDALLDLRRVGGAHEYSADVTIG